MHIWLGQIELPNSFPSILTIELKLQYGDADLYMARDGRVPTVYSHDHRAFCNESNNKTARIVLDAAVVDNRRRKEAGQAPLPPTSSYIVAVHSPLSGAKFTLWAFASASAAEIDTSGRINALVRSFEILANHTTSELWNNLPKLQNAARTIAQSEAQDNQMKAAASSIFAQMGGAEARDSSGVGAGGYSDLANFMIESRQGSPSDKGVDRQFSSESGLAKESEMEKEEDEEEKILENIESFVARAGRAAMRRAMADVFHPAGDADSSACSSSVSSFVDPNLHRELYLKPTLRPAASEFRSSTMVAQPADEVIGIEQDMNFWTDGLPLHRERRVVNSQSMSALPAVRGAVGPPGSSGGGVVATLRAEIGSSRLPNITSKTGQAAKAKRALQKPITPIAYTLRKDPFAESQKYA